MEGIYGSLLTYSEEIEDESAGEKLQKVKFISVKMLLSLIHLMVLLRMLADFSKDIVVYLESTESLY